ncbi:hypothetical protein BV898_09608 [Hypsibius exemplaris]|uniref:G-protein coupled receptors family 1 profile domain-containing protein n=1 Tax=Hypsibius exemplaris TaxID=2072580 RepID=A0A1W0WM61_HYPEX|nr:hypothetical protein BV898_09608 [Hypsibius exemplaris]
METTFNGSFPYDRNTTPSFNVRPSDYFCLVRLNSTNQPRPPPETPVIAAWIYLTGGFCIVGVSTNLLLLAVLSSSANLRRSVGGLIAHLSFNYFLLSSIIVPVSITLVQTAASGLQPEHCQLCRAYLLFYYFFNVLSNWIEGLLAANRLVAVLLPTYYHLVRPRRIQLMSLGLCYTFVVAVSVLVALDLDSLATIKMSQQGQCNIVAHSQSVRVLLAWNLYCPQILSTLGMVALSRKFLLCHRRSARVAATQQLQSTHELSPNSGTAARGGTGPGGPALPAPSERRKQMTRMLAFSFFLNFTCQMPLFILIQGFPHVNASYPNVLMFLRFLAVVQYALTPVAFLIMNKDYQEGLIMIWHAVGRLAGWIAEACSGGARSQSKRSLYASGED